MHSSMLHDKGRKEHKRRLTHTLKENLSKLEALKKQKQKADANQDAAKSIIESYLTKMKNLWYNLY